MKRILINATQPEELRVAMVDGQKLYDLDIEVPSREQKKANVYKAVVTRVEPSLEAAFVNYGAERHGFLPLKEIARSCLPSGGNGEGDESQQGSIKDLVKEGMELIVQVEKEERGNKGAALTTFVSLAGRYLVLMPNNPRAGGVSRRIEGEDRSEIREALSQLEVPQGMGLIARTAGVGRGVEELQWDLEYLKTLWAAITEAAESRKAPFLVYQESNVIIRALRDHMRNDISEIIVDDPAVHRQAQEFMQQVMPNNLRKLKLYEEHVPLFNRYQVESQIEAAFQRQVSLPSGGAIVIDHTEALISIDVNSARATKGSDIEDTALNTNLEAADEIARQLRLRDLGGLIVIDFIDMGPARNQREVENRLRDALEVDRARVQVGRISRFGLLEMSRQRLRPSLGESSQIVCPRCSGHGHIRSVESLALSVLRLVEEEAMKDKTGRVLAQLPVDVSTFLLNEKRDAVNAIERRHGVMVTLVPTPDMVTPHFQVRRIRFDDVPEELRDKSSYQMLPEPDVVEVISATTELPDLERPAVQTIRPPAPAPRAEETPRTPPSEPRETEARPGFLTRVWKSLFAGTSQGGAEDEASPSRPRKSRAASGRSDREDDGKRGGRTQSNRRTTGRTRNRRSGADEGSDAEAKKKAQSSPRPDSGTGTEANKPDQDTDGGKPSGRSRGRRGGRRRRRGGGGEDRQNGERQSSGEGQGAGQDRASAARETRSGKTAGGNPPQPGGSEPRHGAEDAAGDVAAGSPPAREKGTATDTPAAGAPRPGAGQDTSPARPETPPGKRDLSPAPGDRSGEAQDRDTTGNKPVAEHSRQSGDAGARPASGDTPPTGSPTARDKTASTDAPASRQAAPAGEHRPPAGQGAGQVSEGKPSEPRRGSPVPARPVSETVLSTRDSSAPPRTRPESAVLPSAAQAPAKAAPPPRPAATESATRVAEPATTGAQERPRPVEPVGADKPGGG
ncbi:Rne/Rng family ribonuclease [Thioalkalivibrio thiocyanodenitrificans]|uniref:Rne/Rng family ribonuclease n=1 Tax=Thioalkalivibrio thiocyanodenitrificans TaxID=243063 RepID=UPI00039FBD2D|nr:Rne/Rng family ribonuclease [Thioalkalivibrio thiocyanodenitrificans]